MEKNKTKQMTFLEHLEELRWTIIWIIVATLAGTAVAWYYSEEVIELLSGDLARILERAIGSDYTYRLHVFEVAEAFTTKLKVSFLIGFLLALPFNIYKIWRFVSPGLCAGERRRVGPLVALSIALFYAGVCFAYLIMVKLSVAFLFRLKPPSVIPTVRMGSYVSFVTKFCITFGLVFQVPLILAVVARLGLVSVATIRKGWRYAFVGVLLLSAVLTPPDLISQVLMAVPVLLLYWLGYLLARAFEIKARKRV
jgi:sec-independent protein translocase protein TatC